MPQIACPSCGAALSIPQNSQVDSLQCPRCQKVLRLNPRSRPATSKSALLVDSPIGKRRTTDETSLKDDLDSSSQNLKTVPRNESSNAKPWFLRPFVWLLAGTGFLVLLCAGVSAVGIVFFTRHIDESIDQLATRTAPPPIRVDKVDLSQLLADWEKNPIAVIEQHKGADVEVTGFVNEISSNIHHQTYLIISPKENRDWRNPHMQVHLPDADLVSQMKDHPNGSRITIRVSLDQPVDKTLRCTGVKIMPTQQEEVKVSPTPSTQTPKHKQADNVPANAPPNRPQEKRGGAEPKKLVDAKDIFKDFMQNEIAGSKKYGGNLVQVQGCVWELGKKDGKALVVLETQEVFSVVYKGFYCVFDDDTGLDDIIVKQSVATVKGEVADYTKRKVPLATSSLDAHPEYQEFVKLVHCKVVGIEKSGSALKAAEAKKAQAEEEAKRQRRQAEEEAAARREREAQRQVERAQKEREEAKARSALRAALQLASRGFEKEARKRYQEVIDKYPNTEGAAAAKKLLDKP